MVTCFVDRSLGSFLGKSVFLHFKRSLAKFDIPCGERTSLVVTSHQLTNKNQFNLSKSLEKFNSKITHFDIKTVLPLLTVSLGRGGLPP